MYFRNFFLRLCFKPSAAQLYPNIGRVPPLDSRLSLFCFLFYDTNSPLPRPRPRHLHPPAALALLSTPSLLVPRAAHPHPLSIDLYHPVRGASFLLFPVPGYNLILSEYCSRSPPHCQWKKLTRNKQVSRPG